MATPSERSIIASIAAHTRWSHEDNRAGATAKARNNSPASLEYWKRKVDPNGKLAPGVRLKLAENAKAAYYQKAALRMRQAKAAKRAGAA
ncbi:hypothetical protein [Sphaerisporangium sp. TRM90804]|uniref:hypothetical protein n=1 Tax=Sphaerisporangium sp. TRM90804 TaxID=3031113 RepID=UPI0024482019|nr:hypothetical protein [Sphaerisporangium sp. TRM90804]MDH2424858.1 hypothetical protein [Sphaerisporangium sp. TRM90804]